MTRLVVAVVFDLGGVVFDSPLVAMRAFEAELGLAAGALGRLVVGGGDDGAWARYERGEIDAAAFHRAFEAEGAAAGIVFSAEEMMERINGAARPRPLMLRAIAKLRSSGFKVAALTNNWSGMGHTAEVEERFDVVVQSWQLGMRKPDPRIYRHTCGLLRAAPGDVAFLDDLGGNLKAARRLGMRTIKVADPVPALEELEALVGVSLIN